VKLQTIAQNVPVKTELSLTREIYDRYSGMLLGYLTEVLRDRQQAETYLIEIFNELPAHLSKYYSSEKSVWVQLQLLAKAKLARFTASRKDCSQMDDELNSRWKQTGSNLAQLSTLQRTIFCGIYYHNKTINILSSELQEPEETIKRILKQAFNIIRNGR
jgi:DNA-directed RNA polymerase specialized sigma24 family protein